MAAAAAIVGHGRFGPGQAPAVTGTPVANGTYGTTSSNMVQNLSISWVDFIWDDTIKAYTLTQRISLMLGGGLLLYYPLTYSIPAVLRSNGALTWKDDIGFAELNQKFGSADSNVILSDSLNLPDGTIEYTIEVPLIFDKNDLAAVMSAAPSELSISLLAGGVKQASLQFLQNAITVVSVADIRGTAYHFAFIQEVWRLLANTFVDSTLFKRSGAPLVDDTQKPIAWEQLLSGDDKLIDQQGLVTDAAGDTVSVPIGGSATPIVKLISDVVNSQALSDEEKSQAMVSLNAAVTLAWQTQAGVAASLLAKTLDVTQSLSALVLRWAQETPYRWLKATWALKGIVGAAGDIPAAYLSNLHEIARCALLCQQFSLSAAAVQHLLDHPDRFGLPSPYSTDVTLGVLYMLGRYDDLLHQVGGSGAGTEDDVLAYLEAVNGSPPLKEQDAAERLAALLGWETEEVLASWTVLGGIAMTVPQLDAVMRLQQAQRDIGLTVGQQQQAFALDRDSGHDTWQAVGQAMVAGASHVKGAD
jgi:hypothetical protein